MFSKSLMKNLILAINIVVMPVQHWALTFLKNKHGSHSYILHCIFWSIIFVIRF